MTCHRLRNTKEIEMDQYRVVILKSPEEIEQKYVDRLDFKEITEALGKEKVVGIFIGKETNP